MLQCGGDFKKRLGFDPICDDCPSPQKPNLQARLRFRAGGDAVGDFIPNRFFLATRRATVGAPAALHFHLICWVCGWRILHISR
jgi:hypothetical protein